jgi:hypothetical protein
VGCLLYVANVTRPDMAYAASTLARFMGSPTKALIQQARCALRYLWGTKDHKLVFGVSRGSSIAAGSAGTAALYTDADWANCTETRRSVTGYVINMYGTAIIWASKKQPVLATSTMGAEYIAASMATDDALMVIKLLNDFGVPARPLPLFCDNQSTCKVLENPIENGRSKHLDVHWHYVRERVSMGDLKVTWVRTKDNVADIFTKPVVGKQFAALRWQLGIRG